jgi:hypothetical protein
VTTSAGEPRRFAGSPAIAILSRSRSPRHRSGYRAGMNTIHRNPRVWILVAIAIVAVLVVLLVTSGGGGGGGGY